MESDGSRNSDNQNCLFFLSQYMCVSRLASYPLCYISGSGNPGRSGNLSSSLYATYHQELCVLTSPGVGAVNPCRQRQSRKGTKTQKIMHTPMLVLRMFLTLVRCACTGIASASGEEQAGARNRHSKLK